MSNAFEPQLPKDLTAALHQAEKLASDKNLIMAFHLAADDAGLREKAVRNPTKFLAEYKIEVPPSINVQFVEVELAGRPYPMGPFFQLLLTKCRTYWRWSIGKDGKPAKPEQVTICFGLEIVPTKWPFGPVA